ncbi:uncharacterized protein Z518_00407 [Rhinocladiella mackenziei CBS 650.93]|uniref:Uncharacterized protein n=1 Tax=Rhinocladiella mackenziei CBS 650.93 TaxID=1442369 RepID=A0A0D2HF47_9EURO|nr:uncharacterized protein Z518_00407 [Rhinocladiella mackenziei CBS 650.93]KIX09328.1 hypothetical protein Z518_00407 [Rhinocladiella mackenziei CBS 650.93]
MNDSTVETSRSPQGHPDVEVEPDVHEAHGRRPGSQSSPSLPFDYQPERAICRTRKSFTSPIKSAGHKIKEFVLDLLNAKNRVIVMMHLHLAIGVDNRRDLQALKTIVSECKKDLVDPEEGKTIQLHIPANHNCDKGTQGFWARLDTGSLVQSFVREGVILDINGTYTPLESLTAGRRARCQNIRSLGVNQLPLPVLGIASLQVFHPDAPNVLITWPYMVLSQECDIECDFLLGTDWLYALETCLQAKKTRSRQNATTVSMAYVVDGPAENDVRMSRDEKRIHEFISHAHLAA